MTEVKDPLVLAREILHARSGVPLAVYQELYAAFEGQPGTLPLILPSLLPLLDHPGPVRGWILSYMDLAFCRGALNMEGRHNRTSSALTCRCR